MKRPPLPPNQPDMFGGPVQPSMLAEWRDPSAAGEQPDPAAAEIARRHARPLPGQIALQEKAP